MKKQGKALIVGLVLSFWLTFLFAQAPSNSKPAAGFSYPPAMPGAQERIYKTVGKAKLSLYIFQPAGHKASDRSPAIVFFFGGGWSSGSPGQFLTQCQHLASRGMVAISADYRVASRHGVKIPECVQDAKSAVRWIRSHSSELGIDPRRIAAGGGSAGGHIAACTGTVTGFEEAGEDMAVSSVPDAMVLFNPALILSPAGLETIFPKEKMDSLAQRAGTDPARISPYHHLCKGIPPTIIFHGTADTTVPFKSVELFAKSMDSFGNRCRLVPYPDKEHGFFNYGRADEKTYQSVLEEMDRFLEEQGFLKKR